VERTTADDRRRYLHDAVFHKIVNVLVAGLAVRAHGTAVDPHYAMTELEAAVRVAEAIYGERARRRRSPRPVRAATGD